jgi:hypothetical protein
VRPALVAVLLLVAAALLSLGVALPARADRDAARERFAQARAQRERVRAQLALAERSGAAGRTPEAGAAAARTLRASLLHATDGLPVSAVQIEASSERGRPGARGRLSAAGRMGDVLTLADRLARGSSGVMVQQLMLVAGREGTPLVRLDVQCASGRRAP